MAFGTGEAFYYDLGSGLFYFLLIGGAILGIYFAIKLKKK